MILEYQIHNKIKGKIQVTSAYLYLHYILVFVLTIRKFFQLRDSSISLTIRKYVV